jgi:acetoin:2,6-dichlorophenolindophenol oxidoreductase subunit alpha
MAMSERDAVAPLERTAASADQLISMYTCMVRIREFESTINDLFLAAKIPGFVHVYMGEEAVAAGVAAALREDDYVASTHRGHGHVIAKGGDLKLMMAELFGKSTGYCHGKGGSMHIADVGLHMLGANGIVGAGIPIATGAAFACRYRGDDAVAVAFFGDGATNRGTFHEALNLAAVWGLPVVYVCENNFYGEFTRQRLTMKVCDIAGRARAYGIPSETVDGNDVGAVYAAATDAVARARRGEGPSLIECQTWRHGGHFVGDPSLERDPAEHDGWLAKDPLPRCRKEIVEAGYATEKELDEILAAARSEIAEAVAYAEGSDWPSPDDVLTHVLVDVGG